MKVQLFNRKTCFSLCVILTFLGFITMSYGASGVSLSVVGKTAKTTTDIVTGVTYTLTVTNTGTASDTILLQTSAEDPEADDVLGTLSTSSIVLTGGDSSDVTLTVTGDSDLVPSDYPVTVTATSDTDSNETAQVTLKTTFALAGVSLAVVGSTAKTTTDIVTGVTYTLKVTNTADSSDTILLQTSAEDPEADDVLGTLSTSSIVLSGGDSSNVTLTVTGDSDLVPSDYPVTVTATSNTDSNESQQVTLTTTIAVPSTADATPGLSGQELSQLDALFTYDTLVINELYNGADDTTDWLELRNVSGADLPLERWQLTIRTGTGTVVVPFPAGTVLPAGEVLLLTNTAMATADTSISFVVAETFALPQVNFALILRNPVAFGDLVGNYFEGERSETAPELTVGIVWERTQPIVTGYRAEAWTASAAATGTPGYQPSAVSADLNKDGVVNILDLVLVASQFGTTGITAADLNGDNKVNIQDLVLVANAWGDVAAAPAAGQSSAALVNTWLQLAQQNASDAVSTSLPDGFSYARGIQVLEQLAEALTPEKTALLVNYPNPFNPETWIPYQLSKAADVTITIHASDGNLVRMLVLGHQDAGTYKTRTQAAYWDGKNALGETVASGLYFYTLTAGDFTATRRMLILK